MGSRSLLEKSGLNIVDTKEAMADRKELAVEPLASEPIVPKLILRTGDKVEAVRASIVPQAYMDCEFSIEKIKENQTKQAKVSKRKFKVRNFDSYSEVTTGIISTIIANLVPNQSYVIGAPNGFGKTSFVNTCLMRLFSQGKICTPYISLTDLAYLKRSNEERLLKGIDSRDKYGAYYIKEATYEEYLDAVYEKFDSKMYSKKPINIVDRFSWSEYMNCSVLFCFFTDVSAKVIESETLKTILSIRGVKGLPTIAMISTSLDPYTKDKYLGEFVWNEIISYDDTPSIDRVKHVSCYKDYNAPLEIYRREEGK